MAREVLKAKFMGNNCVQVEAKKSSTIAPNSKTQESSFLQQGYQDQVETETNSPTTEKQLSTSGQPSPTPPPSDPPPISHSFGRISVLPLQAKLTIGKPNDKYEQEADRVAEQVMRMAEPRSPVAVINRPITPLMQRLCSECEEELQRQPIEPEENEELVQTKGSRKSKPAITLERSLRNTKGQGNAIEPETRSRMDSAFGKDFSHIRIHTDSTAVQLSQDLRAEAFTYGSDIYFNQGKYQPGSQPGEQLLAHELTHTIQQGASQKNSELTPGIQEKLSTRSTTPEIQRFPGLLDIAESVIDSAGDALDEAGDV